MGGEGGKKENPNDDKSDVVDKEDSPNDEGE
jgi:hypothetical protein